MTTTVEGLPTQNPHESVATNRFAGRQTLALTVRSEWSKLVTLHSTWIASAIALGITVLTGAGLTVASVNSGRGPAWTNLTAGTVFGEIVVAVLGALVVTSEYSSGQIRSTLAAVPHRSRLYAAKALVIAAWSFLLGTVSILTTWAVATPLMSTERISLSDQRVLGFVWGSGLGFAAIALLSLGLGFLLRSTAAAISLVVSLLFVLPIPFGLLSARYTWAAKVSEIIPSTSINAVIDPFSAQSIWADTPGSHAWLTHSQALCAFTAWILVVAAAGALTFQHRDA